MQSHLKRFLFVCMAEFGLFQRQKQPAVVRAVHEIGYISLTFTGTTEGEAGRQTCISKMTLNTLVHLKVCASLFLFPT